MVRPTSGLTESVTVDWVRRTARRLLDEQLEELVSLAVSRVHADEPEYRQSQVSQQDLKRSMRRTLALALIRVTGDPIPDELQTAASEVGRLRAEQGLSLPALLHSYRIDLKILWEALFAEGQAEGVSSGKGLLDAWILVWEAVEANTTEVVDAYRMTKEDIAKSLDVLRARAFERLLESGDTDPWAVREASKRLRIPEDGRFLVLVAEDVPVDHGLLVSATARVRARGMPSYLNWVGDDVVGVVELGGRPPEAALAHLEALGSWKCGAAAVDGLREVPRGVRLARAVIRSLDGPRLRLLEVDWPAVMVHADEELAGALAQNVLGPLLALPDSDRAAVFETLDAYVRGSGSVAEVAAETLRHRNTVRNRLQTVERVTGLSLARPRDLAAITLAMSWRGRLHERS